MEPVSVLYETSKSVVRNLLEHPTKPPAASHKTSSDAKPMSVLYEIYSGMRSVSVFHETSNSIVQNLQERRTKFLQVCKLEAYFTKPI